MFSLRDFIIGSSVLSRQVCKLINIVQSKLIDHWLCDAPSVFYVVGGAILLMELRASLANCQLHLSKRLLVFLSLRFKAAKRVV